MRSNKFLVLFLISAVLTPFFGFKWSINPEKLIPLNSEITEDIIGEGMDILPDKPQPPRKSKFKNKVYIVVDQTPEFPGGKEALSRYLGHYLNYPEIAYVKNIQGTVVLRFVIEKDGSIGKVIILKSVHESLDNEAIRVVKNMPRWHPGMHKGRLVRVWFTLPVIFQLPK